MKSDSVFQEFKPAIRFLLLFVVVYTVGNLLYGFWIERWRPFPDPMTVMVTQQTVAVLGALGESASTLRNPESSTVSIIANERTVLRVFEGCNGINVLIVFVAFLIAFGGDRKRWWMFMVLGLMLLHIANLTRITMLYLTAAYRPTLFYYFHKYLFTATLYLVVFVLWYVWMNKAFTKQNDGTPAKK